MIDEELEAQTDVRVLVYELNRVTKISVQHGNAGQVSRSFEKTRTMPLVVVWSWDVDTHFRRPNRRLAVQITWVRRCILVLRASLVLTVMRIFLLLFVVHRLMPLLHVFHLLVRAVWQGNKPEDTELACFRSVWPKKQSD